MKRIILKSGEEHRIALGHPWVYDNEIARVLDGPGVPPEKTVALEAGELADVESSRKEYLGRAYVNPASKIRARIYSPSKEGLDKGFFKRRLREAIARRLAERARGGIYDGGIYDDGAAGVTGNAAFGNGGARGTERSGGLRAESMRVLFGEADFLPGLIIDRYVGWPLAEAEARVPARPLTFTALEMALGPPESWLAVQFLSWGVDCRRAAILAAIEEVFAPLGPPAGVVEKSAAPVRELEGLAPQDGLIAGEVPAGGIVIFENGLPFAVDLAEGQKTGHFLDQRENRLRAAAYAHGDVLDAFCYSGGFAVHAARYGVALPGIVNFGDANSGDAHSGDAKPGDGRIGDDALNAPESGGAGPGNTESNAGSANSGDAGKPLRVTAVDVSKAALGLARRNAALNGVEDRITTVEADVFDYLRAAARRKEKYDLIILDPPAFAKSKSVLQNALRGYREINSAALKLLHSGGVLVSCSCSQAVDQEHFSRMITEAAADADRRLVQLDFRYQAADHPVRVGYGESLYLKCGFYRAL
jgi:23S rRNA (cytosine1962-C5)-methyltransferase